MEKIEVLTLSTAHVPSVEEVGKTGALSAYFPGNDGGFVFVDGVDEAEDPEWFVELAAFAKQQGCRWVRLDPEAEPVDGLPRFD